MVPHGFKFNPTDGELIEILDRKASGQEMPLDFILETRFYEHEPQELEWNQTRGLSNGERYYYCRRGINDSREVLGRGWWKATSHVKKVYANNDNQVLLVGNKRPLTFHRFKDNERNRNNAIKTNWIMHEYSLESRTTEWRLCKIKYKGRPSLQEEMESIKKQYSSRNDLEASSSTNFVGGQQHIHEEQTLLPANSTMSMHYHHLHDQQPHDDQWNIMQQLPPSPYYACLPPASSTSGGDYHVDHDQQEELEPSDHDQHPFPSLWSWTN